MTQEKMEWNTDIDFQLKKKEVMWMTGQSVHLINTFSLFLKERKQIVKETFQIHLGSRHAFPFFFLPKKYCKIYKFKTYTRSDLNKNISNNISIINYSHIWNLSYNLNLFHDCFMPNNLFSFKLTIKELVNFN